MLSGTSAFNQLISEIARHLAARTDLAGVRMRANLWHKAKYQRDNLEYLMTERTDAIQPDDPERGQKVFQQFLEVVLLDQLGEDLVNDPQFHLLVSDVKKTLESTAELRPLVEAASMYLLGD